MIKHKRRLALVGKKTTWGAIPLRNKIFCQKWIYERKKMVAVS